MIRAGHHIVAQYHVSTLLQRAIGFLGDTIVYLAEKLAKYAVEDVSFDKFSEKLLQEVKRRIVDSFAVMMGAYNAEPPTISRKVAQLGASDEYGATLFGSTRKTTVDYASFANGCHVRYLDFNDTYLSKEALHPSDMIPAIIAVGEAEKTDGQRVFEGIVAAYEIVGRLADAASIRARGWDHVTYIAIATAVGAGKVMGLDTHKMTQAINLATTPNVALRQTRAGEISMWKGCAAANAARNGVFAAMLAKHGMTGPSPVFEGEMGFFKQVSGEFTIDKLGGVNDEYKLFETSIKYHPVEYHAMSAVDAALKLREKMGGFREEDVEKIDIETFTVSYVIIVKDPEKWDPKTRETADHSLPYIVSVALLDGKVWLDSFAPERVLAEDVRKVMKKMSIRVNPEFDKVYPKGIPNKITVRLKNGDTYSELVTYPRGHFMNPMSDEELEQKFHKLGEGFMSEERRKAALDLLWRMDRLSDMSEVMKAFARG